MKTIKYVIGIDTGTHTGVARFDLISGKLDMVESMMIHNALEFAQGYIDNALFVIEDATKWSGYRKGQSTKELASRAQGAGSVKRDSRIWVDFLEDNEAFFIRLSPKQAGAKKNAKEFRMITGWEERTNQHGRDAAMMIIGYTDLYVQQLYRNFINRN